MDRNKAISIIMTGLYIVQRSGWKRGNIGLLLEKVVSGLMNMLKAGIDI